MPKHRSEMQAVAAGPRILQRERDFVPETRPGSVRDASDHSGQEGDEGSGGGRHEKISRLEEERLGPIRIENESEGEGNENMVLGLRVLQKS